jgi:glyoxylase-like metal-dependent hydrolase (beta-lactamase superfamily II)
MTVTRRTALTGAAMLAASPLVPNAPAQAAAPAAGKQAPGFYRYKVGDIEMTVVTDGLNRYKFADDHVANANRETLNKALEANFMEKDMILNPYNPVVINTGGKLAIVDTGTGEATFTSSKGATGQLLTNLAAAGIDPAAIDTVVISHYHGDHINGLLKADNSLAFPNAEIVVPAVEHKYWMDDGEMSRAPKGRMEGNFKNVRRVFSADLLKRVKTYEWDKDVLPGVKAVGTPGHSMGHTSYVVSSGAQKVFVQSDVTHVPFLFVRNPQWHAFYDQDAAMAETTRRKVYDMLVAEKMMVQGFHFPFPSQAYVQKSGNGYREIAVPWSPTI